MASHGTYCVSGTVKNVTSLMINRSYCSMHAKETEVIKNGDWCCQAKKVKIKKEIRKKILKVNSEVVLQ